MSGTSTVTKLDLVLPYLLGIETSLKLRIQRVHTILQVIPYL